MEVVVLDTWSLVGLAVDGLLLLWLLTSLNRGARDGFVSALMGLVAVAVAVIGASILSAMIVDPLTELVIESDSAEILSEISYNTTRQVVRVLSGIVIGLVLIIVVKMIGKSASRTLNEVPLVGNMNQLLGALLNLLVTAVFIFTLLYAWEVFFMESWEKVMSGAPVTRFLCTNNPIASLFGKGDWVTICN